MDTIKKARELGAALQADPAYIRYAKAKLANDKDEELQAKIGEFNLTRLRLDNELSRGDEKDENLVKEINDKLRALYNEIMLGEAMKEYNDAKRGVDKLVSDINSIIAMCVEGEDPETCEITSCTGNCSGCGGCH